MKINGINRTVTSSTQIQIFERCDTVGVMQCEWHVGSEGTCESGFRVLVEGFRPETKGFRSFPVIFGQFRSFPVISGQFLKIKSASRTGQQARGARWVSHQPSAMHWPMQFIRPNPAKSDHRIFKTTSVVPPDAGLAINILPPAARAPMRPTPPGNQALVGGETHESGQSHHEISMIFDEFWHSLKN